MNVYLATTMHQPIYWCVIYDYRVFSWGWGVHGHLGQGDTDERLVPTLVSALESQYIVKIAAGYGHSLALTKQVRVCLLSDKYKH